MAMRKGKQKKDKFTTSETYQSSSTPRLGGNLGSAQEQAYFQKQEQEIQKQREAKKEAERKAEEELKKSQEEEFFCPECKTEKLQLNIRKNLEFRVCPKCKGAWIKYGALTKIQNEQTGIVAKFINFFKSDDK